MSTPVYHNPIFLQAQYYQNPPGSHNISSNISIGNVASDTLLFQFEAFDWEENTLGYTTAGLSEIPGNLSINASTGWLSGNINRDVAVDTPYSFTVTAYKTANAFYATTVPVTITVINPKGQGIAWTSPAVLGNIVPGTPSTFRINAEVVEPFETAVEGGATANCTMKLVGVNIQNGGNNFSVGNFLNVPGGISTNAANIVVTSVSTIGSITGVSIGPATQEYTKLPPLTVVWPNPNPDANIGSYNAVVTLSFGVDTVPVLTRGNFYDTATIGFSSTGETTPAQASARILDNGVVDIVVNETGENYQAVPDVTINGRALVTATNPISYSIIGSQLPTGLYLQSNGIITGLPSTQYFSLDSNTLFDNNATTFDTAYTFTVQASIATNDPETVTEIDLVGDNFVVQDQQTLVQVQKQFTINVVGNYNGNWSDAPKTNLSLEFLLSEKDRYSLFAPLHDETIVPNSSIFRQGDFYFGIAPHCRILMAYGINPTIPDVMVAALAKYHYNKTFLLTPLQWAQSTSEGYEVIYIVPRDVFTDTSGLTFQGDIVAGNEQLFEMTADSTDFSADSYVYRASDINQNDLFPATLPNMINQLHRTLTAFDEAFLPSWMTDVQPNGQILGFTPAIPLLYVQPGQGAKVLFYLQQYYDTIGPALNTIEATTDRYIWNAGYAENWSVRPSVTATGNTVNSNIALGSTFTVNVAIPTTYTANLTPRTYTFGGNTTISFPVGITTVGNVAALINGYEITGLLAGWDSNYNLTIESTYGTPFFLYDGINTPLANLGISAGLYGNIVASNWIVSELTQFDVLNTNVSVPIDTETGVDITTELGDVIITEEIIGGPSTTFTDVPEFFEISDVFLTDDEGSVYLLFPQRSIINQPPVTV